MRVGTVINHDNCEACVAKAIEPALAQVPQRVLQAVCTLPALSGTEVLVRALAG